MRILQIGLQGQDVLDAQCALAELKIYSDDIDGSFGPHLQAAVKIFQQNKGLPVTGIIDAATAAALGLQDPPPVICVIAGITPEGIAGMFPSTHTANIEANLPYILNALAEVSLGDRSMIVVALATMSAEAARFLPVSEGIWSGNTSPGGQPFDKYAHILGNTGLEDAANFRGRGFIQITGRSNYQTYSRELFGDSRLVDDPLLAHRPEVAARVLAHYLADRAPKFRRYLANDDLKDARALVNGADNGIGSFSWAYTEGLKLPCIQLLQA
ncbi:MAG TPA: peptidoglycan-binding protein [Bryobacteraceae bacterium]|jgi:peptidoglycan L-alanyl-D-glutamate endopeptidase CwlK|nr:peptidoglycan-binding protein [Bryobacteraceae bacterium]